MLGGKHVFFLFSDPFATLLPAQETQISRLWQEVGEECCGFFFWMITFCMKGGFWALSSFHMCPGKGRMTQDARYIFGVWFISACPMTRWASLWWNVPLSEANGSCLGAVWGSGLYPHSDALLPPFLGKKKWSCFCMVCWLGCGSIECKPLQLSWPERGLCWKFSCSSGGRGCSSCFITHRSSIVSGCEWEIRRGMTFWFAWDITSLLLLN